MRKREDLIYHRYGIYGIRNLDNGKVYIGQTINNFGDRWDNHRALLRHGNHYNSHLQSDWNEYGESSFEFFIVEECDADIIDQREIDYVAEYASCGLTYNVAAGGSNTTFSGRAMPDEVKQKIAAKNRINSTGKKASDETKKKMSDAHKGILHGPMSKEQKELLSKSHQEYYEKHPKKLTVDDVREIRKLHVAGQSYANLARQFGVTGTCISDICNYKRWKQVQ